MLEYNLLIYRLKNLVHLAQMIANYSGQTYDGLTFILTSFENNILKGEFSGEIKTRTGLVKTVEEGEFKANLKLR